MAKIKSTAAIAEKWSRVTPQRTEDYRLGIENPRVDWEAATAGSEEVYKAGVQAAVARNAFSAGVKRAGTAKWQAKALQKGTGRFAEGVTLAADDYERGFAPFRDVIERVALPPKAPRGDPRNIERVRVIAKALRDRKISGK